MMGLYRKNEVLFAVAWIVLYVVVCGNLRSLGDDSPAMMVGLAAICAGLALFIWKNGLSEKYGLASWSENSRQMLWFVPLWVIASANLWGGIKAHYAMPGLAFAMVSMALVGFAEEVIFRGLLFKAMLGSGSERSAIAVSSITFGMGHIVNLLNGQATLETAVQIAYAIAIGLVFTLAFHHGGSLWPCIIAHSLIDVTSVASNREGLLNWIYLGVSLAVIVAYCAYLVRVHKSRAGHAREAGSGSRP